MPQAQTIEGTWEELAAHSDEFQGKKLRITVIEESAPAQGEPQTLAELLGDFIGCINGSGANNSDDTGNRFKDYVNKKHQGGRL